MVASRSAARCGPCPVSVRSQERRRVSRSSTPSVSGQAGGRARAGLRRLRWSARGAGGARAGAAARGRRRPGGARAASAAATGTPGRATIRTSSCRTCPGTSWPARWPRSAPGVRNWRVGDRVTVPFVNACGTLRAVRGRRAAGVRPADPAGLHALGLDGRVRRPRRRRREPGRRARRARPRHRRRAGLPLRHRLPGRGAGGGGAGRRVGGGARLRRRGAVRRADRGRGRRPGDRRRRGAGGPRPRPRARRRARASTAPATCRRRSSS